MKLVTGFSLKLPRGPGAFCDPVVFVVRQYHIRVTRGKDTSALSSLSILACVLTSNCHFLQEEITRF